MIIMTKSLISIIMMNRCHVILSLMLFVRACLWDFYTFSVFFLHFILCCRTMLSSVFIFCLFQICSLSKDAVPQWRRRRGTGSICWEMNNKFKNNGKVCRADVSAVTFREPLCTFLINKGKESGHSGE